MKYRESVNIQSLLATKKEGRTIEFVFIFLCLLGSCCLQAKESSPGGSSLPCQFRWDALVLPNGQVKNFTTPAKRQPFQNPCMSFAHVGVVESMYEIQNNVPDANLNLSEGHFYYKYYNLPFYPLTANYLIPTEACGNFPPNCTVEAGICKINTKVYPFVNSYKTCYEITPKPDEGSSSGLKYDPDPKSNVGIDWYHINTSNVLALSTEEDLKFSIMDNGPVIMKVNGKAAIDQFRNYGLSQNTNFNFHAFMVLGWQDTPQGTRWLIKDSWYGDFFYSYAAPDIYNNVTVYEVHGTQEDGQLTWPNRVVFNPKSQCIGPAVNNNLKPLISSLNTDPGINTGIWYTIHSTTTCNTDISEYDYDIPSSMVQNQSDNNCSSQIEFKLDDNYSSNTLTIKVRAKSLQGVWSDWYYQSIMVNDML